MYCTILHEKNKHSKLFTICEVYNSYNSSHVCVIVHSAKLYSLCMRCFIPCIIYQKLIFVFDFIIRVK